MSTQLKCSHTAAAESPISIPTSGTWPPCFRCHDGAVELLWSLCSHSGGPQSSCITYGADGVLLVSQDDMAATGMLHTMAHCTASSRRSSSSNRWCKS